MALNVPPREMARLIRSTGLTRAAIWTDFSKGSGSGKIRTSGLPESFAGPLRDHLENSRDWKDHAGCFLEVAPRGQRFGDTVLGAFVHSNVRGQAGGGVRLASYDQVTSYIADGVRLGLGMGRKSATAGLWHGGGKGVIALDNAFSEDTSEDGTYADAKDNQASTRQLLTPLTEPRRSLFRSYGSFVTSLRGAYVVAEDAGVDTPDMGFIFETTRFATCIPAVLGGSSNPSPATARGVVCSIEAAVDALGMRAPGAEKDFEGVRFNVQGMGNVSVPMMEELIDRGAASIYATEVDPRRFDLAKPRLEAAASRTGCKIDLQLVQPEDTSVFTTPCDILCPNALGASLNAETVPLISQECRVVCGAANNQLADEERDSVSLSSRGIAFVPDFVANRMGIVQCANEQYGYLSSDPAIERHFGKDWSGSIYNVTREVLEKGGGDATTPYHVARSLADELIEEPHPIWGDRAQLVIDELVQGDWVNGSVKDLEIE